MDTLTVFVLYLAVFRLAIIGTGIMSVLLGYLLLVKGVFPKTGMKAPGKGEEVTAQFAGAKFTLRNVTPGTCFALFGVLVIAVMLFKAPPEVTLEFLEKGGVKAVLRGGEVGEVPSHSSKALAYLNQGDKMKASGTVQEALGLLAGPLNDFAWVLSKTDPESPQAGLLADLAVSITPRDPNFLHTLAEIQYKDGKKQEAMKTLEKASRLNPIFKDQLEKWRREIR